MSMQYKDRTKWSLLLLPRAWQDGKPAASLSVKQEVRPPVLGQKWAGGLKKWLYVPQQRIHPNSSRFSDPLGWRAAAWLTHTPAAYPTTTWTGPNGSSYQVCASMQWRGALGTRSSLVHVKCCIITDWITAASWTNHMTRWVMITW